MGATPAQENPTARMFAADQASRLLGIELLEHGEGTAVLRMTVTASMVDGHGTAHGGYLFPLAGTAFACACNSHGPVTVASGADVTFVAPAHEGDVLTASAREIALPRALGFARAGGTPTGRSGIYDVSVVRGETVIAEFRGRSRSVRSKEFEEPQ